MSKSPCAVCNNTCNHTVQSYFTCYLCSNNVHTACLQKDSTLCLVLKGDVFFKFSCQSCSPSKKDVLVREKLPWLKVVILAMYNLHKTSPGLSNRGYFHWKLHVSEFISNQWNVLFGSTVKKKRAWLGTVSGSLSHYSPGIFTSGTPELKDGGWWKLTRLVKPQIILDEHYVTKPQAKKQKCNISSPAHSEDLGFDDTSRSSAESWNQIRTTTNVHNMYSKEYVEPSETLSNCLFADDMEEGLNDFDLDIDCCDSGGALNISEGFDDFLFSIEDFSQITDVKTKQSETDIQPSCNDTILSGVSTQDKVKDEELSENDAEDETSSEKLPYKPPKTLPKSLFNVQTNAKERCRPWLKQILEEQSSSNCIPMNEFEEMELMYSLRQASSCPDFPPEARRLHRKLTVRCLKRRRNMAVFDLDSPDITSRFRRRLVTSSRDVRLLDRFQRATPLKSLPNEHSSFSVRLMGQTEPTTFYSPYTQRVLKPYIRRDKSTTPLWLKLMNELLVKANKNNPSWKPLERWPIDYCYVRPHHIASINSLCCEHFYPGVDLSECLTYPDFSCVALYKKLVIGFAFLVPDVGSNETYISFLFTRPRWRNAGIASFMLYHLIQTCMGKDVTLHVSVTNPALILYQKFGFKVEEFVQDFYDKYLPPDSTECKHALFLRLSR